MADIYARTELLLGSGPMDRIKASKVLVAGLGGVGGYVCEALARAGVGTLGLCDMDSFEETNLNRQVLATVGTVGKKKAETACLRVRTINPQAAVYAFDMRICEESIGALNIASWDWVADCIDDVSAKVALICAAREAGVAVISSMGTGNKLDPSAFRIADISRTEADRLAKAVRKKLRERRIYEGVEALYSPESPRTEVRGAVPSISYMPAAAGMLMAGRIIRGIAGIEL